MLKLFWQRGGFAVEWVRTGGEPQQRGMHHIVYVSSATRLWSRTELFHLLDVCRRNNQRTGITGILLYRDGNFMQAIEGEEPELRNLMRTILLDPRHRDVIPLLDEPVPQREFPEWTMAFRDLERPEYRDLPGFSDFLDAPLTATEFGGQPGRVRALLALFRRNIR